jgi:1-acyl-sn-glycerol-3-phosphate acyltransferase
MRKASFWILIYPTAIIIGVVVLFLRFIGFLHIRGTKFPHNRKSIMMVSNHPSLWEPIVLIGLFFREYVFHPRRIPWSTPDQRNYADVWYWGLFKTRFIPIPRGSPIGEGRALVRIISTLEGEGNVIVFPEGGRTCKGTRFFFSRSGKRLREIKNGAGRIPCEAGCTVVPVWVDGGEKILPIGKFFPRVWKGMTITIGESFTENLPENHNKEGFEKGTRHIVDALLKTAG